MPDVAESVYPNGVPIASTGAPSVNEPAAAERQRMEMARRDVDPDDGEVARGIRADDGAARGRSIRQVHRDRVGVGDHVVVRDDRPVAIDLESGAERRLGLGLALAGEDALPARDRHPAP